MLWITFVIIISYLIGSIPTGYIFGRILKDIDIRKFGSGNIGATNVFRVVGRTAGIAVLILDVLKGLLTLVFVGNFAISKVSYVPAELLYIIVGLSCICGHNWTIFLGLKGGKGIATTLGVLIGLAIKVSDLKVVLLLVILTWMVVFLILRIVSIASVVSAISLPVYMMFFNQSYTLISLSFILMFFVIIRHKSNLKRFFQGKEPRLF